MEVGPFRVNDAAFDAQVTIEAHHHDRPNLGVMLRGSFDLTMGGRSFECDQGSLFFEPAGETHCNCIGCLGARVLAVQPDPDHPDLNLGQPIKSFLGGPARLQNPQVAHLARRIAEECRTSDSYSPLMVEGLALELLAVFSRATSPKPSATGWLATVETILREAEPGPIRIGDFARRVGVHPSHLAREFRRRYRRSIGRFLLERRLEWAARQLSGTDRPIVEVGLRAGFADQSHFTRRFREYAGATPREYRIKTRPRQS
jgi:AraC family transcriptional regulator